ncbi:MAG TPA: 30S ribosomal protein S16 [Patescibacteria group bacterium]|jgi:small subunit ribosomal protein S16|nr:30S ribosomal protein S16 [Patescibacteria group bacterium]
MLSIRLQRTGAKSKPDFRVILTESHRAANKKFLEILGHYNPRSKEFGVKNQDRLNYWIAQNVTISPTVRNLLVEKKLITGKKVKAWQPKSKPAAEVVKTETAASPEAKPEPAA